MFRRSEIGANSIEESFCNGHVTVLSLDRQGEKPIDDGFTIDTAYLKYIAFISVVKRKRERKSDQLPS